MQVFSSTAICISLNDHIVAFFNKIYKNNIDTSCMGRRKENRDGRLDWEESLYLNRKKQLNGSCTTDYRMKKSNNFSLMPAI